MKSLLIIPAILMFILDFNAIVVLAYVLTYTGYRLTIQSDRNQSIREISQ